MRRLWLMAVIAVASTAQADAVTNGDWPCVQIRVPALSIGTFWTGQPIDEAAKKAWREDAGVAKLVAKLVSRRTSIEDAEKLVAEFAAKLAPENKAQTLTLVFAGVFYELDTSRSGLIGDIERFTRTQRKIAENTNKARAELDQLRALAEKSEQQRARIEELQTALQWQMRLHKERESTVRYVCETPVLLEQRIFAIGRAVQGAM